MNTTSPAAYTPKARQEPNEPEHNIVRIDDHREEIIRRLEEAWDRAAAELFGELRAA